MARKSDSHEASHPSQSAHPSSAQASQVAAARRELEAQGAAMHDEGVSPYEISVEALLAPIEPIAAIVNDAPSEFAKRQCGPAELQAVREIGSDLTRETASFPADLRTLRKRPAAILVLIAEASGYLGAMHKLVRRRARGKKMRTLASRFSARTGNTPAELIADIRSYLSTARDPLVNQGFKFLPEDLDLLASYETRLATVSAELAARGGVTTAQVAAADKKQLAIEAFYATLGAYAGIVFRERPKRAEDLLKLLPRNNAGRSTASEGDGEGTGSGEGTGGGEEADAGGGTTSASPKSAPAKSPKG